MAALASLPLDLHGYIVVTPVGAGTEDLIEDLTVHNVAGGDMLCGCNLVNR